MPTAKDIQKALERESEDNIISHRNLAPATNEKYDGVKFIWNIWRLSRGEPEDDFSNLKDTPDPTPQQLKSFAEHYITSRDKLPSQQTACDRLFALTSMWERGSSRSLDLEVKRDVVNYICNDLTTKYQLRTEPRERFLVNAKDIDYLLHHLFDGDSHDFKHERARVQTGSSLSLFAGSGSRAGAIVESSSYRHSNECLYYRHLSFHIKWSEKDRRLMRWVTIDPKFLKGQRIRDDKVSPKNWFNEHPILGKSFVFWVIVHGVADGAFKDLDSVEKVLSMKPPKGRESWTLEWTEDAEKLPFFRAVTTDGPAASKALSFSSLHHNNTKLAVRDGFKDKLRVHGIRGGVANMIDPKASEATRGQALDHQNHNTFLKYQSPLKALDIQAVFYDLEPNYECRSMEQSMSHHRDVNVPQKLSAAAIAEFLEREDIIKINQKISSLNYKIDHRPEDHKDLALERAKLYDEKSKLLHNWKAEFVKKWWDASYTEYVAGNDFSERDTTRLFDICRKYMPERDRLSENLFEEATLDSLVGRQCLTDMVALCKSTERVAYYPGMLPEKGKCPICSRPISR
ncbi:hypothetical protein N7490_005215 [Penicillium lividum]|nr:hypothetical protein N7490_005215 [Penicillium lividum]